MKTLIINGNPKKNSLCESIAKSYFKAVNNVDVKLIHLYELDFKYNYTDDIVDEPAIVSAREMITNAEHLVFVFPLWWGAFPAILKAFIDRTFISGFAYRYQKGGQIPEKLLTGKTADLIITMDSPVWYYRFFKGARAEKIMKHDILGFCGIKTRKILRIGRVRELTGEEISSIVENDLTT